MRARSVLFTLFGDVIRPTGGEAWLTTITAAMGTLGFNPQAVRTALHRMAAEGWVEPRKSGRYAAYRLTQRGVVRLEEAASRIYRLKSIEWDGRWHLLLWPGLDARSDLAAELRWIGFGLLQLGVWVSPHDHDEAIATLLARGEGQPFRFDQASSPLDGRVASTAWDLAGLRTQHEEFLDRWQDVVVPAEPAEAFAARLQLVHHWRSFLFSDPGLPAEVLPDDWPGHRAAEVFRAVYDQLVAPATAWYELATSDGRMPALASPPTAAGTNPFAAGLAALDGPSTAGRATP